MMGCRKALLLSLVVVIGLAPLAWGRMAPEAKQRDFERYQVSGAVEVPLTQAKVHHIGNLAFCITNYGFFGSQARALRDACTNRNAPSMEFPSNSGKDYLFQGALWVGAVKNGDTLVSVGADGWS